MGLRPARSSSQVIVRARGRVWSSKAAPGLGIIGIVIGRQGRRSHAIEAGRDLLEALRVVLGGVEAGEGGAVCIIELSRRLAVEGQARIGTPGARRPGGRVILEHFLVLLAHLGASTTLVAAGIEDGAWEARVVVVVVDVRINDIIYARSRQKHERASSFLYLAPPPKPHAKSGQQVAVDSCALASRFKVFVGWESVCHTQLPTGDGVEASSGVWAVFSPFLSRRDRRQTRRQERHYKEGRVEDQIDRPKERSRSTSCVRAQRVGRGSRRKEKGGRRLKLCRVQVDLEEKVTFKMWDA